MKRCAWTEVHLGSNVALASIDAVGACRVGGFSRRCGASRRPSHTNTAKATNAHTSTNTKSEVAGGALPVVLTGGCGCIVRIAGERNGFRELVRGSGGLPSTWMDTTILGFVGAKLESSGFDSNADAELGAHWS